MQRCLFLVLYVIQYFRKKHGIVELLVEPFFPTEIYPPRNEHLPFFVGKMIRRGIAARTEQGNAKGSDLTEVPKEN